MNQTLALVLSVILTRFLHGGAVWCDEADTLPPPKTSAYNYRRNQFRFTITLLDALQQNSPNQNVFFSPYNLYHTLLLAYFGAEGVSERELANFLGLQWAQHKHDVYLAYALEKQIRYFRSKRMLLEFMSDEKLFVDSDVKLNPCLSELLPNEIQSVNFDRSNETQLYINDWVAHATNNELKDILNENDTISNSDELLLTNTAVFKILWENQFNRSYTQREIFYSTSEKFVLVDMMKKNGEFDVYIDQDLEAHVVIIPYANLPESEKSNEIVMIFLLPPFVRDIDNTLRRLTVDSLEHAIRQSTPSDVDISLPRFELITQQNLKDVLINAGLRSIFDESLSDFSGFSTSHKLKLNNVKQAAKITMDEKGSTPNRPFVSFRLPSDPIKMTFNHPFLFLIYDKSTQVVLFAGIIRKPFIASH